MLKLLVPIDGSVHAQRAVRYALGLCAGGVAVEIFLLNVQEPIVDWEVRRFLREDEIEQMLTAKANAVLDAAGAVGEAGCTVHRLVYIGNTAQGIAEQAQTLGCDQIIMGTRGMGALHGMLLGAVSTKVLHLVDIPVTLVK
jgi:nucleotide-binding universal stress UspA family protein